MSQSTTTSIRRRSSSGLHGIMRLVDAMAVLRQAFEKKSEEFKDIIKMGRTQLQDAVPRRWGRNSTYAVMLGEDEQRLKEALLLVCEITWARLQLARHQLASDYAVWCAGIANRHRIPVVTASNLVEATKIAARSCSSPAC